jgi:hypothetical protein
MIRASLIKQSLTKSARFSNRLWDRWSCHPIRNSRHQPARRPLRNADNRSPPRRGGQQSKSTNQDNRAGAEPHLTNHRQLIIVNEVRLRIRPLIPSTALFDAVAGRRSETQIAKLTQLLLTKVLVYPNTRGRPHYQRNNTNGDYVFVDTAPRISP